MAERSGNKLFMDISELGSIMDVLKRHRLKPSEKLDVLGIELGLSGRSVEVIGSYCDLLKMICKCLALPEDQYSQALYVVRLREILSLWLKMVDNVYQRGGATWVALDNALYEVDKDTAMKIRIEQEKNFEKKHFRSRYEQLEAALKEGTIRVRYTNLLLCGLPRSGRSSFLRLLLGRDVNDDNPIARMVMRTPQLKFEDLAKHRWEWDKLDYATLRTIVTSHVKSCGAAARPRDMSKQSTSATFVTQKQPHHHSTDERKAPSSSDEYAFEDFLIKSLSQHVQHQRKVFEAEEDGMLGDMVLHKLESQYVVFGEYGMLGDMVLDTLESEDFLKMLLSFRTKGDLSNYIILLRKTFLNLSQFKRNDPEQLLQKGEIVDSFSDKLYKLCDPRFERVLQMIFSLTQRPRYLFPYHLHHSMLLSPMHSIPFTSSASSTSPTRLARLPSEPEVLPPHPSSVCNEILSSLPTAELPDGKALHFINIIATSGPLSFLNTIPAILSYTTVNLITHRLDILLEEKILYPESTIPLEDEILYPESTIEGATHIDMLDSLIRSLSFSQKPHTEGVMARMEPKHNKKMFAVVGSCFDRINEEILDKKNELLDERFGKFSDVLLRDAGSILFAVNNLKRSENEEEKLMLIRRKVCQHYVEADIPIRWYLLQLELRAQESRDVLPLDEVLRIGKTLQMSEDDVKNALSFFHDMTIIFYFPVVLPGVVFVKPQVLISRLLALTNQSALLGLQVNQPGLVDSSYVKTILETICGDVFTSDKFLQLLEGLLIVSREIALRAPVPVSSFCLAKRSDLSKNRHSIVFAWDQKVPRGLFQALCVKLGQSGWGFPSKCLHNLVSFRDKQVTLINHDCCWIEIYYEGDDLRSPSEIKNKIYNLMQEILKPFNIDTTGLRPLEEYFFCSRHHSMDHLCSLSTDSGKTAICLLDGSEFKLTDKQELWLDAGAKSGRHKVPQSLDITDLNKVLTALKNSHFSSHKWEDLGLRLGLRYHTLYLIQAKNPRDNDACLRECIAVWLQRADGVDRKGRPSYVTLAEALEEMEQKNTAYHIRASSSLTMAHLDDVLRLLHEGQFSMAHWKELGLRLGLSYSTLRVIEIENRRLTERCLRECITKWLQRADGVDSKGGANYATLAEALEKIDQKNTADHIRGEALEEMGERYTAYHIRASSSLTMAHLDDVLRLLHEGQFSMAHWKKLGLRLGLSYSTLRVIEIENRRLTEMCLRECITKWLQRADGVDSKGGANYATLAEALEKIDQKNTADHIRGEALEEMGERYTADHIRASSSLTMTHLPDISMLLHESHFPMAHWFELGLQLGLYKPTLSNIQANYPRGNNACLTECIARWLQRADGVDSKGGANYDALAEALEEMGEKSTANYIRTGSWKNNFM